MKQQQKNQWSRWFWKVIPSLYITIFTSNVFAQTNPACPAPRDSSDGVKIEVLTQEAAKSKGEFEDAGTITTKKYLEELRKLVILISTKQDAIKKIRDQLDLDEISLKALDQQIQDQLTAVVGAQKAADLSEQWNQGATDEERAKIIREFSGSRGTYQNLMLSLAKKSGVSDDDLKKVKDISMDFASVSAGEFRMGSSVGSKGEPAEEGRHLNEAPRMVKITKPYEVGKTEFTQFQYLTLMGTVPDDFKKYYQADRSAADYMEVNGVQINANRSMVYVSWNDAQEIVRRLSEQDSKYTYRLPTEAEWEYAARAGTTTAYSFGNSKANLEEYAVFNTSSTAQVASKKPNSLGLYDVHGNVWEWCKDGYCSAPKGYEDPTGDDSSSYRVLRGGSWFNVNPRFLRSADRYFDIPGGRLGNVGFRLVRTAK